MAFSEGDFFIYFTTSEHSKLTGVTLKLRLERKTPQRLNC